MHKRQNWNFCRTELAAKQVGIVQSAITTCRLLEIDVCTYPVNVPQRVGPHPAPRRTHPSVMEAAFRRQSTALGLTYPRRVTPSAGKIPATAQGSTSPRVVRVVHNRLREQKPPARTTRFFQRLGSLFECKTIVVHSRESGMGRLLPTRRSADVSAG